MCSSDLCEDRSRVNGDLFFCEELFLFGPQNRGPHGGGLFAGHCDAQSRRLFTADPEDRGRVRGSTRRGPRRSLWDFPVEGGELGECGDSGALSLDAKNEIVLIGESAEWEHSE